MNDTETKKLCISLAKADTEQDVINLLQQAGFWEDPSAWKDYGDYENNFATIGNQQSSPDAALVEKLVNSVDAVLMRECLRRRIKPKSASAPQTVEEALERFFKISGGNLSNLDAYSRTSLAQNILLVASGRKSQPCYSIIDLGEGQTPKNIPNTFLSLNKSIKLRIPFVQGKFNMGGSGALQFCGQHNLQLIISKRDPKVAEPKDDETKDMWGFTVVRRENPHGKVRNSVFRYLAPKGNVLMFNSNTLPLLPRDYPEPHGRALEWGTLVKLYEYQLAGYKTLVVFDLYNRLSLLLPNIALPIRMMERRKGYSGHTLEATLSGLSVRLEEDRRENLELNFPSSSNIKIMGQEMNILIYAFKKGKRDKYARKESAIFIVNGQAHGFLPKAFFERKAVGMSYLADSILLLVDCSKFDGRTREDLFMNSRDRLREGPLLSEIENQLEILIKNHPGLRALREQRRREEIESRLEDSKPLAEMLQDIINKSPSLSKLLLEGVKIENPFKLTKTGTQEEFEGVRFPTYFKLTNDYPKEKPKLCPANRKFRVQFETDAENDYFNRETDHGEFTIMFNEKPIDDRGWNLWNGMATLTVTLPSGVEIGDLLLFKTYVSDTSRVDPFYNEFYIKVAPAERKHEGRAGDGKSPASRKAGKDREAPSYLEIPEFKTVKRDEWDRYGFNEDSALRVRDTGEGGYDFFINIDNKYLRVEEKGNTKVDPRLLEARFTYGMVLLGISLLNAFENETKKDRNTTRSSADEASIYDRIFSISSAVSPVLLPMISSLGDLQVEE